MRGKPDWRLEGLGGRNLELGFSHMDGLATWLSPEYASNNLKFPSQKGSTEMKRIKHLTVIAFSLLTLIFLTHTPRAHAQAPAYLHAISDLRTAREYLKFDARPEFDGRRHRAIEEISKAIDEMTKAAIDDGKNPWHTPPPQSGGDANAPIHSALRLLDEAHSDASHGTDIPENRGLQLRSLHHIETAQGELRQILAGAR